MIWNVIFYYICRISKDESKQLYLNFNNFVKRIVKIIRDTFKVIDF